MVERSCAPGLIISRVVVEECFPFLARLFQCSLQLHQLSSTPGEAAGEQVKVTKPLLCLSFFGDPFIGPSSEHEKHFPHSPKSAWFAALLPA